MDIRQRLKSIFEALQELELKATYNNSKIMLGCLRALQEIYAALDEEAGGNGADGEAE